LTLGLFLGNRKRRKRRKRRREERAHIALINNCTDCTWKAELINLHHWPLAVLLHIDRSFLSALLGDREEAPSQLSSEAGFSLDCCWKLPNAELQLLL